ncbi:hypothetical protein NSQ91_02855 [Paenibacillus sp. FSL R7-0048]|jgi:hypothetical protein|uniref:hypothetical protein n=1 Tax=Paenibacillus TaxID=44249 RepID=UPI00096D1B6F|nr:hypothetical protein [Paenibacillus odorifer]OMD71476.1 hypothetical protein BSK48_12145 [Paenibacillus odorifer]OME00229.1 hypothetical protein BSK54_17580 [Paenibacillus odorifer]
MQIKITKSGLKKDEVFFLTEFGEGRGIWCGAPVNPGAEMDVELELSELLMRWVDIHPVPAGEFNIRLEQDRVIFTGVLENIEEDGTGFLRIGEGLVMFECLGEPMALGVFVELQVRDVRIYPFSI